MLLNKRSGSLATRRVVKQQPHNMNHTGVILAIDQLNTQILVL